MLHQKMVSRERHSALEEFLARHTRPRLIIFMHRDHVRHLFVQPRNELGLVGEDVTLDRAATAVPLFDSLATHEASLVEVAVGRDVLEAFGLQRALGAAEAESGRVNEVAQTGLLLVTEPCVCGRRRAIYEKQTKTWDNKGQAPSQDVTKTLTPNLLLVKFYFFMILSKIIISINLNEKCERQIQMECRNKYLIKKCQSFYFDLLG